MKKNLMKLITLALALVLLASLPARDAAATFTFGGSTSGQEEKAEPETQKGQKTAEPEAETAGEESAPAPGNEDGAESAEGAENAEGAEEPAAGSAGEADAAEAFELEFEVTGFSGELEELAPKFEEILNSASKWSKKKAPQTLADFPALPDNYQAVYEWMGGKTAVFAEADGAYTVTVEVPDFVESVLIGLEATAYFKDMSKLQMTRTDFGVFSAEKPENAPYQAADFWRIDLSTPAVQASEAEDGAVWHSGAWFSIASAGLFGPAGGTDEIRFEVHRSTAEANQSIVWYIRRGELTVDIYYGNGNEVCRELTYDIQTGKLVSSEEW